MEMTVFPKNTYATFVLVVALIISCANCNGERLSKDNFSNEFNKKLWSRPGKDARPRVGKRKEIMKDLWPRTW